MSHNRNLGNPKLTGALVNLVSEIVWIKEDYQESGESDFLGCFL